MPKIAKLLGLNPIQIPYKISFQRFTMVVKQMQTIGVKNKTKLTKIKKLIKKLSLHLSIRERN